MKTKYLLATAGILALGWGAIVVSQVNDQPIEVETYTIPSEPAEAVVEAPVSHSKAVQEVLEPQTVESAIVEERVSIVQEKPYWRKFLDEKKLISEYHADAVNCIDNWSSYMNAESAFRMSQVADFGQANESIKNDTVESTFNYSYSIRPCAPRVPLF